MWTWQQFPRNALRLVRGDAKRSAHWIDPDGAVGVKFVDVTVSTAELLALNATPKQIVAAPGAGFANVFEGAIFYMPYNSIAYAGIAAGEDLSVKYTNGSGLEVSEVETTGFLDQTADQMRYASPHRAASGINSITPTANAALVLQLLTGEITTGNSPLRLRVFYRVIPTTLPA